MANKIRHSQIIGAFDPSLKDHSGAFLNDGIVFPGQLPDWMTSEVSTDNTEPSASLSESANMLIYCDHSGGCQEPLGVERESVGHQIRCLSCSKVTNSVSVSRETACHCYGARCTCTKIVERRKEDETRLHNRVWRLDAVVQSHIMSASHPSKEEGLYYSTPPTMIQSADV